MTLTEARPGRVAGTGLRYAYLMTAVALGSIVISGVLGSIFSPDFVSTSGTATGFTHEHAHVAAYSGWIWDVIAIAMVLPAAMKGFRAKVTDRVAWTVLGLGAGGLWLAVMFVSIFAPVMVTGTAPWQTWVPLGSILAVIAGIVLTYILCRLVKETFFQPAEARSPAETTPPVVTPEFASDGTATKLRQLAQLHDSGVITDAEFQAKKDELLSRI